MSDLTQQNHGLCGVCAADATDRCDYRDDTGHACHHWLCFDHSVVEAQHWDRRGWDGVDVRCQEHRNLSIDVRDVFRGSGLLPAPRWEGAELLTAY